MNLWLKNIGATDDRIKPKWFDEGSNEGEFRWHVRFSDAFPAKTISRGDLLLYNAFIQGQEQSRLVGVARVSSDKAESDPRSSTDQWPWKRAVTPVLIVPLGGHGALLTDVGIEHPLRGGYKELDPKQFTDAVRLLACNALPGDLATRL